VGGSKGKGTTCAFLEGLGRAAGLRTGVYLSPHVETLLERIRMDGTEVAIDDLERALRTVTAHAQERGLEITFFEAMTAAARDLFAAHRTDLAVYEVGLGGRFDATTAIPVDAAIVTGIELEYTEILGSTIAAIAAEKAPVIRPRGTGVTAAQGEALAVIEAHARSASAELLVLGRDFALEQQEWRGTTFRARLRLPGGETLPLALADARAYEPPLLALAATALARALPHLALQLDPAPRPQLPCRFEIFRTRDGVVILDGAHTEQSLRAVAMELRRRFPGRPTAVLFASAQGKRWREGLKELLPTADSVLVTGLSGTTGEDPEIIMGWLRERGCRTGLVADADAGLQELLLRPSPRLVTGSFYLAGHVRTLLRTSGAEHWHG